VLVGCGGGGGGGGPTAPTLREPTSTGLTGTWKGWWSAYSPVGQYGDATVSISQSGSTLSGTYSLTGSPCFSSGQVTGTIVGWPTTVNAEVELVFYASGGAKGIYQGYADLRDAYPLVPLMNLGYSINGGPCNGQGGVLSVLKQL
jgi:hypothetical protein